MAAKVRPRLSLLFVGSAVVFAASIARAGDESSSAEPPADVESLRTAIGEAKANGDEPKDLSLLYLRLATAEENAGLFSQSLADYRTVSDLAPSARWARNARNRIEWLNAHAEGGFAPLARLRRLGHDGLRTSYPVAIDALGRDAESFPPGPVRAEARMRVAEAWLQRPDRRSDGYAELRRVIADPSSDGTNLMLAKTDLVDSLVADGDVLGAQAEAHERDRGAVEPALVQRVDRLSRRWVARRVAMIVLALSAVSLALLSLGVFMTRERAVRSPLYGSAAAATLLMSLAATAYLVIEAAAPAALLRLGL